MDFGLFQPLAIALGLGLLVGLQRQWRESEIAGIRTFPLITLLGAVAVILDGQKPAWVTSAGLLTVAAVLYIGNLSKLKRDEFDPGLTTETAALLMYGVGAALSAGYTAPAIAVGGTVAVLLHWKEQLHGLVRRIGEEDFKAVIHLVLIALVILPLLPDETYGPYHVFNPFEIWLMVVLIVSISLVAYVTYKLLGASVGAVLGGLLGGLVSSTATTVSYARQTKGNPQGSAISALVILIASTIVYVRVLFEIGIVAPQLLQLALLPICLMMALMAVLCGLLFLPVGRQAGKPISHDNPAQLKAAIIFGVLYAVVLFVVAAARDVYGSGAMYAVAVLSGLTDMDAITLSTAALVNDGRVTEETAWRVILVATMSNLVFKGGAVAVLGSRRLLLYIVVLFGISLAGGALLVTYWPDIAVDVPAKWSQAAESQTPAK